MGTIHALYQINDQGEIAYYPEQPQPAASE
jgi:hypothetical protein